MNASDEPGPPTHGPFDPQAVRRVKQSLLTEGLLNAPVARSGVRSVIERSWRRCIGEAVPTCPGSITFCDLGERQSMLVQAAQPVLDRLGDHLADMRIALFLSDNKGNIVLRKVSEPCQRNELDNASAAEGFDFSEGSIGTNGIGTVIAERRPLLVRGSEHYNDALEILSCAGTPIFEPFSKRVVGAFALACTVDDTSPLLSAIATDVGRQIETNLTTLLGADERALIQYYLLASRAEKDPVIVLNERTVFANTLGLRHVNSETHALLWTHLRDTAEGRHQQRTRVPLSSGWREAVVEHVDGTAGEHSAYCVRLVPVRPAEAGRPRRAPAPVPGTAPPAQRLHPRDDIDEQLRTTIRHRECVALDGEPGTGKLHVASAIFAAYAPATRPVVLDLSAYRHDNQDSWFAAATDALAAGRGVVLRHLQDLDPASTNRVKAIAELAQHEPGAGPAPLIVTVATTDAPEQIGALLDQLATTVRLPTLAEMPERVPALVTCFLSALPGAESATTFSSEALQLLMRWSWPGNIAELWRTVEFLARRRPGKTVGAGDLPTRMQQTATQRQLTLMETAERDSIITALRQAGGNRSHAAAALGIGRTTLYRKMRFHRIDG